VATTSGTSGTSGAAGTSGSFFSLFTAGEIARISAAGTRVRLPEGWSPIWEDTPADKAYIILSGSVSVRKDGHEVATLGEGDIVGEAAILKRSLRTASIVALTPLELIHLSADALVRLSEEMPRFGQALDAVAAERFGAR
jgi:CRP/FNR family transcriptional regulator, cyclic AMP receptor protein